eukprot:TRINITY_DN383_c1_g1_i1.p2 TRINITY_DN383_c1_g1~~TRINITY_DN383_c1_g1_i1.p2  ORF type:complete len:184 (+),score=25.54 TRINITY_DN383_c1_g1_i1:450-1001(+)
MSVEGVVNRALMKQLYKDGWHAKYVVLPVAGTLRAGAFADPMKKHVHAIMEWDGIIAATRHLEGEVQKRLFLTDGKAHVKEEHIHQVLPPTTSDLPISVRRARMQAYMKEVGVCEDWVNEYARAQGKALYPYTEHQCVCVVGGPIIDEAAWKAAVQHNMAIFTYNEPDFVQCNLDAAITALIE